MRISGSGTRQLVLQSEREALVYKNLVEQLTRGLEKFSLELVVNCGMAEGFDETLARACVEAGVPFHAYIPNPTYGNYYWGRKSLTGKDREPEFHQLVSLAEEVHFTITNGIYTVVDGRRVHSNFARNIEMIKNCDRLWVYDHTSPGTAHAHAYAESIQKPVWLVPVPEIG